jgi:myo-inositol-1(or 4)-monophosphatase
VVIYAQILFFPTRYILETPMHALVNTAVKAARKAGDLISRYRDRVDTIKITPKGINDLVTEIDQWAEQEIIDILRKAYPDHGIMAEESGGKPKDEYVWIIDPLDGTANFVHGFPHFCVSIGCLYKNRLEHGVIYDPVRQELFTATRGRGAQVDGRKMRVSPAKQVQGGLVATGFPFRHPDMLEDYLKLFKDIFEDAAGARRGGSSALDLAYVAAGRLDGYWEIGLQPWDVAAGALMVMEAGGLVSAFDGSEEFLFKQSIVAANPRLHPFFLQKIAPYLDRLTPNKKG